MASLRTLSLFTGAMGLDLGLHRTRKIELVACVESDPASCATIRANAGLLGDPEVIQRDIREVDPNRFEDIDLIVGGPPCQAFSTAGRRRTVQDPRGTLLWEFLRFVDVLRPKAFLIENVRGLVSAALQHRPIRERPENGGPELRPDERPGSALTRFWEDLPEGYALDIVEANAVNYGAPQLRERALLFGRRVGGKLAFPEPTHGPDGLPWKTLGDALRDLDEHAPDVLDFSERKKSFLQRVPAGGNWRSLPEPLQIESMGRAWHAKGGRSGWWRRLSSDLPCPTLMTAPNHASTSLCHPTETRALSIREYARIQEFPDEWVFEGSLSERYAQIGNAVPIRLGEVAGHALLDALKQPDDLRLDAPQTTYVAAHVRTRRWYSGGEAVVRSSPSPKSHAVAD